MAEKEKKFTRKMQTVIGGELLKRSDDDCVRNCMNESEAIRLALREKYIIKPNANKSPFFAEKVGS
jgi:hypothetical protein